jgi:CheY-like chemotaxis protein
MTARWLVLVADDEVAIQGLVGRVITRLGFDALPVGDGAAAIRAVEAHREDLACAILDVVMRIVDGAEAAEAIQRIEPDLPIVIMSGAMPAHCADALSRVHLVGILPKPFPLMALHGLVLQAVGGVALESRMGHMKHTREESYDAFEIAFRAHHQTSHACHSGPYEHYRLVYRYGYDLASDTRYRSAEWPNVERDARPRWEERNPGTWGEFEETIRYAWDTARGRR